MGEGEKLVKAVFSLARRLSPCVVFLDEIDALFGARMSTRESGGAFAHRGVITEFMQEMDGLKSSTENNVIVIGATNRPFDLDDAVLRRLPRRLLVDLPGEQERQGMSPFSSRVTTFPKICVPEILRILLRDESLATDVTIEALAAKTDCFSGSDLKRKISRFWEFVLSLLSFRPLCIRCIRFRQGTCGASLENPTTYRKPFIRITQYNSCSHRRPVDILVRNANRTN